MLVGDVVVYVQCVYCGDLFVVGVGELVDDVDVVGVFLQQQFCCVVVIGVLVFEVEVVVVFDEVLYLYGFDLFDVFVLDQFLYQCDYWYVMYVVFDVEFGVGVVCGFEYLVGVGEVDCEGFFVEYWYFGFEGVDVECGVCVVGGEYYYGVDV